MGETFVTRKITREVAKIALGKSKTLYLGNLNVKETGVMPKLYQSNVVDVATRKT